MFHLVVLESRYIYLAVILEMGVKWLTSYVRSVERIVSTQISFSAEENVESSSSSPRPTFVVDAWAFIFHIWLTYHGDSMRSLDYRNYQSTVQRIIGAWQLAGIKVIFVFDGPWLPAKLRTVIKRKASIAASNSAFMKSSSFSRKAVRFQTQCGVIPPLLLYATIEACQNIPNQQVELIFAPTEADSLVAEIATEKEQGYALSLDSDYFVLCARGKGCPYVPLDSLEFLVQVPAPEQPKSEESSKVDDVDEFSGFMPVKGRKRGYKRNDAPNPAGTSPLTATRQVRDLPPLAGDVEKLNSVTVRIYRPHVLASHLQIPPSLLPLLAALVGNDYTTALQASVLFQQLQGPHRVVEAASILRSEWLKATIESKTVTTSRRGQSRILNLSSSSHEENIFDDSKSDTVQSVASSAMATPTRNTSSLLRSSSILSVQDPVRAMIGSILDKAIGQMEASVVVSRHVSTGERNLIVEAVIDSAATYSLLTHGDAPHLSSPSALFFGHPSSLLTSHLLEVIASPKAIERYRQAYDHGHFKCALVEALTNRVFITTLSAEDPEVQSVQVTAARQLRHWLWGILFEAWGMAWAREEWEEPANDVQAEAVDEKMTEQLNKLDKGYKEGEKPDDVISVDTESSHSISMDEEKEELPSRPGSVTELRNNIVKPAPGIVEYVRRANRYVGELVQILPMKKLLDGELYEAKEAHLPQSIISLQSDYESSETEASNITTTTTTTSAPVPIVLKPLPVRLDLYLHIHRSCTPSIQKLSPSWRVIAATLRFLIQQEAERLGPAKKKLNWSRDELLVALESASHASSSESFTAIQESTTTSKVQEVLPSTRSIHLASTLQLLLENSHLLAQSLLLPVDVPEWPQPHSLYHGITFHRNMFEIENRETSSTFGKKLDSKIKSVLDAITAGLEDDLSIDVSEQRKEKKAKKKEAKVKAEAESKNGIHIESNKARLRQVAAHNPFAVLDEAVN